MSNIKNLRLGGVVNDDGVLENSDGVREYELTMDPPDRALLLGAQISAIFYGESSTEVIKNSISDPQDMHRTATVAFLKALGEEKIIGMINSIIMRSVFVKKDKTSTKLSNIERYNDWFSVHNQDFLPLAIFIAGCYASFFMGEE